MNDTLFLQTKQPVKPL